jgi:hypothetical protein
MTEWKPIETAADAGKQFVVGYEWRGRWVRRVAHRDDLGRWLTAPSNHYIEPTHWLETPLAPTGAANS